DREGARRRHTKAARDAVPHEVAADHSDRDADDRRDSGERRCLPRDRRPYLSTAEAERFQYAELRAATTDRGDERVADSEEGEASDECGDGYGEPIDLTQSI